MAELSTFANLNADNREKNMKIAHVRVIMGFT